ncbi:MAG: CdvA-like protein [Candidatus Bathyarchaeia archaeon]
MSLNSNLFISIGLPVIDEYGRVIGKIASFALAPNGKFEAVFIEHGNGKFLRGSLENLKFEGDKVILLSNIKLRVNVLCDHIPLIWRKDQALKELVEKKKISKELYEELHTSFDGALTQLKEEAQALIEEIDKEINRCINETRELNYALVHLEIEHEIGKVDDKTYETAFAIIQENLKKTSMEKSDLEAAKNKLSNILLGENLKAPKEMESKTQQEFASTPKISELPEPPLVVYVKE